VAASGKKSFHITVTSHNAEVKLCNLYQFAEAFNLPIFHVPSFKKSIWLMLFFHELKQVLALIKQFTLASSVETFFSSRPLYYSHGSTFSHSVVCKRRNLVNAFKFSK